ncbi:MAG: histidine phosphatase family protein [Selenomonadaceae bacterium]|nr:histidine phosphatase family protein [Selenomonadaceae bacterium]MBR1859582.1 histidine phosphatase family protein [Selenomonadaceae bacterium]
MIKIMLVRHGVTEWNNKGRFQGQSNIHLAPDGVHQARLLTAHFPFDIVDAIYCSDLNRAKTTAEVIASRFNLDIIPLVEFREMNFGEWEGRSFESLAQENPIDFKKFFVQPDMLLIKNGETFAEVQNRAMTALRKIINDYESKSRDCHIVIVTHGAVIRVILAEILSMPLRKIWTLKQYNTAINIIRVDDGDYSVELINSTYHLHI